MVQSKNIIQHCKKMVKKTKQEHYIQTLNTSLPHHIAQILKWEFVLALFVFCLYTNTQRRVLRHAHTRAHTYTLSDRGVTCYSSHTMILQMQ